MMKFVSYSSPYLITAHAITIDDDGAVTLGHIKEESEEKIDSIENGH